ncbi:PTS lactose/cellobiose transporter subunit IIA [Paraliobacillus salinarum]|uniref:PTS lactose/cellobiose transporter subunit IIA n=1 Tax=Paraliobacillus salinarum TaxID=1158996 RepID=UPI0015F60FD5|nr:PTS lactose/cellobiose transporter subunit IIA [Paraliobacillus salinarum]
MSQKEELQQISFSIILHAGNARSLSMEAIELAKEKKFDEAVQKVEAASQEFSEAHRYQSELLQKESDDDGQDISVILIHAQDHLMSSMVVRDMANVIIELYREIKGE